MKKEIEIERLKKIDFLNLFEIKYLDWRHEEGKSKIIRVNYYYVNGNAIRDFYNYNKIKKQLKIIYINLDKALKEMKKYKNKYDIDIYESYQDYTKTLNCINKYFCDTNTSYSLVFELMIDKIEKYLLMKKLENKYPEKNILIKRNKI